MVDLFGNSVATIGQFLFTKKRDETNFGDILRGKKEKGRKKDASNARIRSGDEVKIIYRDTFGRKKWKKWWIKDEARNARLEDEHEIEKEAVWVGEWLQERPRCLLPSLTFPTIPSSPSRSPRLSSLLSAFNYFASRRGEQRVRLAIHSTSCFVSTLDEGSLVKTFFLNVGVSSLSSLFSYHPSSENKKIFQTFFQ